MSSKSAIFGIGGLRGSNEPSPPAMATTGALCLVPLFVVTINVPSSCLSIVSALYPRVKPGSKAFICSIKLSTKSPANTSGKAGMS